jgi:hypothetical protein
LPKAAIQHRLWNVGEIVLAVIREDSGLKLFLIHGVVAAENIMSSSCLGKADSF